jgi:GTP-binding protein
MLVSSIDYNDYVGRIGIGRIERGVMRQNQEAMISNFHDKDKAPKKTKIVSISQIDGLSRVAVTEAKMGDIICFSGAGKRHHVR